MSLQNKHEFKFQSFPFEGEVDNDEVSGYLNEVASDGWALVSEQVVSGMEDGTFHILVTFTHKRRKKEAKEDKADGSSIYTS
jgi:hypothetical protein